MILPQFKLPKCEPSTTGRAMLDQIGSQPVCRSGNKGQQSILISYLMSSCGKSRSYAQISRQLITITASSNRLPTFLLPNRQKPTNKSNLDTLELRWLQLPQLPMGTTILSQFPQPTKINTDGYWQRPRQRLLMPPNQLGIKMAVWKNSWFGAKNILIPDVIMRLR